MAGQVSPEELRGNPKSPAIGAAGIILDVQMGKTQGKRDIKKWDTKMPPQTLAPTTPARSCVSTLSYQWLKMTTMISVSPTLFYSFPGEELMSGNMTQRQSWFQSRNEGLSTSAIKDG